MIVKISEQRIWSLIMLSLMIIMVLPKPAFSYAVSQKEDSHIQKVQMQTDKKKPGVPLDVEILNKYPVLRSALDVGKTLTWWNIIIILLLVVICGWILDPVSTSVGEYSFEIPLLDSGGPIPMSFILYYASRIEKFAGFHNDPFGGDAFTHNFQLALWKIDETNISILYIGGNLITFIKDTEWQVVNEEIIYHLKEDDDHYYLMDPILERIYTFEKVTAIWETREGGVLTRIEDRNGNTITLTYETDGIFYQLTRVEDGLGRSFDFTYRNPTETWNYPHIATVTDHAGRTIQFEYEVVTGDDNAMNLVSVSDAMGLTTTFTDTGPVTNNVITGLTQPRGNMRFQQTYEQAPDGWNWRAVSQTDAYDNVTTLDFDDTKGVTTVTDPLGHTSRHTHLDQLVLSEWTDELGHTVRLTYDGLGRRISVIDRMGNETRITYHAQTGKIDSYTDTEGNLTTFAYTPQVQHFTPATTSLRLPEQNQGPRPTRRQNITFTFHNLTTITYADGTHDDFLYDNRGNATTYTDRADNTWTFTYNDMGQPLTIVNPTGGTSTYTYNADGTVHTCSDTDVGVTTYGYDEYFRLSTISRPEGGSIDLTYDLNNRLLTITDELDRIRAFSYDDNGNLTTTNPLNQNVSFTYDLMDRLIERTDPSGHATMYEYDARGQMKSTTDRNGGITTYTSDPRGWLTGTTDPGGHTWSTTYDNEGVPTGFTTPMGFASSFQTNTLGYQTTATDPLGATSHITYDALGNPTSFTDRMGRTTTYTYDNTGFLTSVTKPVIGTASYSRNDLGLLTAITDQNGYHWAFDYSPMGRLINHTDPLDNQWSYAYDSQGRIQHITYPGGTGTADHSYDDAGQITQVAYANGPILNYTYDNAGRPLTANDVTLAYDNRGDMVTCQDGPAPFAATYDAGRRLKTVSYDGQVTVTYTYDPRDLLIRVEDDFSGSWLELAYDADGRVTRTQRSNGTTTNYIYDNAGRLIGIQDEMGNDTLANQMFTLNAEGEQIDVERTLPLDPNLDIPSTNFTFDDAGQISNPDYAYDTRGRQITSPDNAFTYDDTDKLTTITSEAATTHLTYNGLGDLRARTENGTSTTYFHHYALKRSPIVAEKEESTTSGRTLRETDDLAAHTTDPLSGVSGSQAYNRFYVYTPDGHLLYAIDAATGQEQFYHFDRLGTTLFLSDQNGEVSDAYAYGPYGILIEHSGDSDQPFTYIGRHGVRWEPVSNLYHMNARYYDPASGRFLSRDPLWPALDDPQSLNPYQYAHQNPLRYIDPTGMEETQTLITTYVHSIRSSYSLVNMPHEEDILPYSSQEISEPLPYRNHLDHLKRQDRHQEVSSPGEMSILPFLIPTVLLSEMPGFAAAPSKRLAVVKFLGLNICAAYLWSSLSRGPCAAWYGQMMWTSLLVGMYAAALYVPAMGSTISWTVFNAIAYNVALRAFVFQVFLTVFFLTMFR